MNPIINKTLEYDYSDKSIRRFKNIFVGETIYIIGSGKSLDYIDSSFFSDKICIGINQSYKKFIPNFIVRKDDFKNASSVKLANVITIVSAGNCGNKNTNNKKFLEDHKIQNCFYFDHDENNCSDPEIVIEKNSEKLCVSWSTITSGIHFAAYLGAKNIVLCGHDCGTINGEVNFDGYQGKVKYPHWNSKEKYSQWVSNGIVEKQTLNLKRKLKELYNINVLSLNPFINFNLEGNIFKSK